VPALVSVMLPPERRPGWPKLLPCLRCDRPRPATHAGDRFHPHCREVITSAEQGALFPLDRVLPD
jgi:hypothetical protein